MRRIFSTLLLAFIFMFSLTTSSLAMTVSPNSGSFPPHGEQTIAVLAAPPADNVGGVKLRLNIGGATIVPGSVSFTAADENQYLTIGVCEGSKRYTDTTICADMVKTGGATVASGDLLVQFTIKFDEFGLAGKAVIGGDQNNGYLVGNTFTPHTQTILGEYDIVSNVTPSPTPLPVTGIEDYPGLVLLIGIAAVALGVGFFVWRNQEREISTSYN